MQDLRPLLQRDSWNAVLSYLYDILVWELFVVVLAVGFDPDLGFYHQPRYGRPALALDMMEEFRPIIHLPFQQERAEWRRLSAEFKVRSSIPSSAIR